MAEVLDRSETPVAATEKRASPRRRVLKGATLNFNRGYGAFECFVRDVSDNGARLRFGDTLAVPPLFDLTFKGEAGSRPARIRWRTPTEIGVELG